MNGFDSRRQPPGITRRTVAGALAAGPLLADGALAKTPDHPLWPTSGAPVLRGAVIAQRRRRDSVDGRTGGAEAALPAYGAPEFDALAKTGANLVVMSFPELWTATPPYRRDPAMADLLGRQMDAARAAGLYVVVGLRSGPGRSDFIFHRDAAGTWFPKDMVVDRIWTDRDAQAAWADMCVDVAKLIAPRRETAGLILMVEPDPNVGGRDHAGAVLDAWSPEAYARRVADMSDWRRVASSCAQSVRAAVDDLPVLISPPAFARPDFLSVMGEPPVDGCVWCVHDYEPRDFTHQAEGANVAFNRRTDTFAARLEATTKQGAPVFLGEFGAPRWRRDTPDYVRARIAACEARGVNWAAFRWPTFDAEYEKLDNMFDVRRGAEATLRAAWKKNAKRP